MPKNLKAKVRKEIDRLNGAAPFLIHYHAPGSMRDLRYDGYVDDLLREFTVFECMEDLDWRKHLHFDAKAATAEFWALKRIPGKKRTLEQRRQFAVAAAYKRHIKSASLNPDKSTAVWPASILPAEAHQREAG